MRELMTVKVKQDALMDALGSWGGFGWLCCSPSLPGWKAGGCWHHPLPTPKPPKRREWHLSGKGR